MDASTNISIILLLAIVSKAPDKHLPPTDRQFLDSLTLSLIIFLVYKNQPNMPYIKIVMASAKYNDL